MTKSLASPGYIAFQVSTSAWYALLRSFGFRISYDDADTIAMYATAIEEVLRRPTLATRPPSKTPRKSLLGNSEVRSH